MAHEAPNEYRPDYAVPPGEVLEHELELRGMTKSELARRTGLTEKHINAIARAKGKANITPETAIRLERALGMPAQYWLNLEAQYQEVRARLAEEQRLENELDWLDRFPVSHMTRLGWLPRHRDRTARLVELLRFFGIAGPDQWAEVWPRLNVAYRQHTRHEIRPEAVSAWLRRGELQAAAIECAAYDRAAFREALDRVRPLTAEPDPGVLVPAMQALCAAAGVAVVLVPALPKTSVSGATRWVSPHKAIIQLSLRYKSNDQLWFTFFHEAGHILLHSKKELFIEGVDGIDQTKEAEANRFAEQELIPRQAFAAFAQRGLFSKTAISEFARSIGVAPGIVVGQLQHKGLLPMSHCNGLKVRYRWDHE